MCVSVCVLIPYNIYYMYIYILLCTYMHTSRMFTVLSAILHIGNVTFRKVPVLVNTSHSRDVQDCHQRLSSAFDLLLIFLCFLNSNPNPTP